MKIVTFTEEQFQAMAGVLDAALKMGGLRVVKAVTLALEATDKAQDVPDPTAPKPEAPSEPV